MDDEQKKKLKEMIEKNNTVDRTKDIRNTKHSDLILADVNMLEKLKKNEKDIKRLSDKTKTHCKFIYETYPEIYYKLLSGNYDFNIMRNQLKLLKDIESGKLSQHEAAFKLGTILKEEYIDPEINSNPKRESINISWKQYSKMTRK